MKHMIVLLTLLLASTLAMVAAKPGSTRPATLSVSCSVCDPGETVTITGSGFGSRASVQFSISGPWGAGMTLTANGKGQFVVSYPIGLNATVGEYTVAATSSTASASTTFDVQ